MLYTFNGIDPDTGQYLIPPMEAADIVQAARLGRVPDQQLGEMKALLNAGQAHFGVKAGVEVRDLSSAGWGIVMAEETPQREAILEALQPLINLRRTQAGARFKDYTQAPLAWRKDESKLDFLAARDAGPGDVDPAVIPYYLLLVADPAVIPYDFQYQLDVQYGVGRLWFDGADALKMYDAYARSVVAAERPAAALPRRLAMFGAAHPGDGATQLSSQLLVDPLSAKMKAGQSAWTVDTYLAGQATRTRLDALLGAEAAPALIFTAAHGLGVALGDTRQAALNGAQLCQDWPGAGPALETMYVAGDHVASDARLLGSIGVFFACFGAGTPDLADFPDRKTRTRGPLAERPFVASLPQRLLSHPKGGMLAAIGHIDRAFSCSFRWDGALSPQLTCFESTLTKLMDGYPAGAALEHFNMRYAELASELAARIDQNRKAARQGDDDQMTGLWLANNDARNFVLLGDPAVHLNLADQAAPARTALEPAEFVLGLQLGSPPAPKPAPDQPAGPATGFLERISDRVMEIIGGLGTVEVATYTGDPSAGFENATMRALTRVSLDGHIEACVPQAGGEVDDALWRVHADLVEKALAHRTKLLEMAATFGSRFAGLVK
jgi:hypothetical protein